MTPIVVLALAHISLDLPDIAPAGRYLEARTASVYAGACHYGAEATTSGREAVVAWRIESGRVAGIDLGGVAVAAAIAGDANLADAGTPRRAVLYVAKGAHERAREAAVEWVRARHAGLLGRVLSVEVVDLDVAFEGDAYRARAPGIFAVEGDALPDRACCKMPYNVWYEPFAPVSGAVVGRNQTFALAHKALGRTFSRRDENTGFVAEFGREGPSSDLSRKFANRTTDVFGRRFAPMSRASRG